MIYGNLEDRSRNEKIGFSVFSTSVAEPYHFDAAPSPGKNFGAALASALALYQEKKIFN
jgi:hypothetical protein